MILNFNTMSKCFMVVYEYITKQWRGSSDSKILENINNFAAMPELYVPVNKEKWLDLRVENKFWF